MKLTYQYIILIIAASIFYVSCQSTGSFRKAKKLNRIVSIAPNIDFSATETETEKKGKKSGIMRNNLPNNHEERQYKFKNFLRTAARRYNISLDVVTSENVKKNNDNYFKLMGLRDDIIQTQAMYAYKKRNAKKNANFSQKEPRLSTDINILKQIQKIYKTRYFAVQGIKIINNPNKNNNSLYNKATTSIYFTIIADVETAKIVYEEKRNINGDLSKRYDNLSNIIYDSFLLIKKKL